MRLFAVIPAAGHSRRMGRPKLLLPLGGSTVIERLLAALDHPAIAARVVVVRNDDRSLAAAAAAAGARVVRADPPPVEMRASVEWGLRHVCDELGPRATDGWMLVPADHPVLDAAAIAGIIDKWTKSPLSIVVPVWEGRRGHPALFPWSLAEEAFGLPSDVGLNELVRRHEASVVEWRASNDSVRTDLDTPEDYERLRRRFAPSV